MRYSCLCYLRAFYAILCGHEAQVELTSASWPVLTERRTDPDVLLEWAGVLVFSVDKAQSAGSALIVLPVMVKQRCSIIIPH